MYAHYTYRMLGMSRSVWPFRHDQGAGWMAATLLSTGATTQLSNAAPVVPSAYGRHDRARGGSTGAVSGLSGMDRQCPSWTGDQAEGMTGRVFVNMAAGRKSACAQGQRSGLGIGEVVHHDVEVELLRPGRGSR